SLPPERAAHPFPSVPPLLAARPDGACAPLSSSLALTRDERSGGGGPDEEWRRRSMASSGGGPDEEQRRRRMASSGGGPDEEHRRRSMASSGGGACWWCSFPPLCRHIGGPPPLVVPDANEICRLIAQITW
ncbi:unnamed protein product, partial [Urochloa humidicola]